MSILFINIRKFCLNRSMLGTVELFEKGGTIYLLNSGRGYAYADGKVSVKGLETSVKDKETAVKFIEGTVSLLVTKLPFSIKKLCFEVSEKDLVEGIMRDSSEEEGSMEVALK